MLTLQAKPVSSIHVRENRRLVVLEDSFMAASPKDSNSEGETRCSVEAE
jgi:hypothetical protein